jgi:hypothetical protein
LFSFDARDLRSYQFAQRAAHDWIGPVGAYSANTLFSSWAPELTLFGLAICCGLAAFSKSCLFCAAAGGGESSCYSPALAFWICIPTN